MSAPYDTTARKKAVNLSINADLLAKAKTYGINLSQTTEEHLADLVRREMERRWLEENREAIESFNARVAKRGLFSDNYRRF